MVAALLLLVTASGHAALTPYSQNFETLVQTDVNALASDQWKVFGNVWDPTGLIYLYGYGPFSAPNDGAAFCAIATGQGGATQGNQQLSVYNDYNNTAAHSAGNWVESNVFQEQTIGAGDIGSRWVFRFDAKMGNLAGSSTAKAFIKTLDPGNGYALTNFKQDDMTTISTTWSTRWLAITVDAGMVGQILQFGFLNRATSFTSSGIFYDNLSWAIDNTTDVAGTPPRGGIALLPASPNPFPDATRIAYSIPERADVELSIYDVAGRRIAVLYRGEAGPGTHVATWDGLAADGRRAPSGVYRCVLQSAGRVESRSLAITR